MLWQKDIGDQTDVDESIAVHKDGKVKAPIVGSVVQEVSAQRDDHIPSCTVATTSAQQ